MLCKNPNCGRDEKITRQGYCVRCYGRFRRNGSTDLQLITNSQKGIFACINPKCGKTGVKLTKGLCKNCYYRKWHTGNVDYKVVEKKPCAYEGCEKLAIAKGWCDTHRKRVNRRGSVEAGRPDWWGSFPSRRSRSKESKLQSNFGISLEEYEALFKEQGGVCKICGEPEKRTDPRTGKIYALSVDHCHKTGKIRGLLCMAHNKAIGLFGDSVSLLRAAISYLESSL